MTFAAAWTGGQSSAVRIAASLLLSALLLRTAGDSPFFHTILALIALATAPGARDRGFAVALAILLPFSELDGFSFVTAELWAITHAMLPPAPYGSFDARGRVDPDGGWRITPWVPLAWMIAFIATRLLLGIAAFRAGDLLAGTAFVASGLLAFSPSAGFAAWLISLVTSLVYSTDGGFLFALLFHILTFQPAWLPRREPERDTFVFYDGTCALCHSSVRFLLAEDPAPPRFRLAALGGERFMEFLPEAERATLPDSVALLQRGQVLVRGRAAVEILDALGGLWRLASLVLGLLPRSILNGAYDAVASRRYRWFGRKTDSCPLMPPALRGRIET